jgi:peptidoglycan/LPS O-acetylase OafA/YrhL
VLAVVLNHLYEWPSGAFVGVDVFFVISGFLITSLLLREQENKGRISWRGFYQRRVKRIIPAATLVLVATVVAAYFTFNAVRFKETVIDALAAFIFLSNWRFKAEATDYFNADGAPSPIQHYWSLSIEEQFYFVWPVVMLLVFAVAARRGWSRNGGRIAVGVAIGVIVVMSFGYALAQTGADASGAYFSSLTRVWELGLGAMLAVAAPLCSRIPDVIRPALAWIGLASIIASLFYVDAAQGFPAPAAAWPVLSTALVIAAGTGIAQQRYFWALTNRPMQYIGDASYSLYLWHFPVIVIGTVLIGDDASDKILFLVAMSLLAGFAYALFENPLRRADWSVDGSGQRFLAFVSTNRRWQFTAIGCAAVLVVAMTAAVVTPPDPPRSALSAMPAQPSEGTDPSASPDPQLQDGPKVIALQTQIREALVDSSWPDDLDPSMDQAIGVPIAPAEISACADLPKGPAGPEDCAWGPVGAKRTAVLVGDSVGIAYADALRSATLAKGWRFLSRVGVACPFVDQAVNEGEPTFNAHCEDIKRAAIRDIKTVKPDVLFITNHEWSAPDYEHSTWVAATQRELAKTGNAVGRVVYVAGPPPAPDPAECYTPSSVPADCTAPPSDAWQDMFDTQRQLAAAENGIHVDTEEWFCAENLCPPYVGTMPVRPDRNHVLPAYMIMIQAVINESLDRAGVF